MTSEHTHEPLSSQGLLRRQAILAVAQQALTGRRRAKRARRSIGALALLAVGAAGIVALLPRQAPRKGESLAGRSAAEHGTDRSTPIERLDDDAMLAALASLGVDAGLIEVDGEQRVVTRDGQRLSLREPHRNTHDPATRGES